MTEGDGQFIFERWPGARWHIRRPGFGQPPRAPFYCGMLALRVGPIKFEDELDDDEICGTCRRTALARSALASTQEQGA